MAAVWSGKEILQTSVKNHVFYQTVEKIVSKEIEEGESSRLNMIYKTIVAEQSNISTNFIQLSSSFCHFLNGVSILQISLNLVFISLASMYHKRNNIND